MTESPHRPQIILASGSKYRADLLRRLGLNFLIHPAGIDETVQAGEQGIELTRRLSIEKARHVVEQYPDAIVIGADQVAVIQPEPREPADDEIILGKPGAIEQAKTQLKAMRGRMVHYYSGMAVIHASTELVDVVTTRTRVRELSDSEIKSYLEYDRPFDCAGALKSESLGISLLDELSSDDPTALMGLPLIRLSYWLRDLGYPVP